MADLEKSTNRGNLMQAFYLHCLLMLSQLSLHWAGSYKLYYYLHWMQKEAGVPRRPMRIEDIPGVSKFCHPLSLHADRASIITLLLSPCEFC